MSVQYISQLPFTKVKKKIGEMFAIDPSNFNWKCQTLNLRVGIYKECATQ